MGTIFQTEKTLNVDTRNYLLIKEQFSRRNTTIGFHI